MSEALAVITRWVTEGQGTRAKGQGKKLHRNSLSLQPSALRRPKVVVTPNPEMIVAAQKDPEFLQALQRADLAIPDGIGIVAAMRLLKGQGTRAKGQGKKLHRNSLSLQPLALSPRPSVIHRISGISLMEDLIRLAAQNGWRVILVGGKEGVAEKAAQRLRLKFQTTPKSQTFQIIGLGGPPDVNRASSYDLDHLITSINKIKPDLLFVAFGHGKQEKWMAQHRDRLDVGAMMGVGGALDQIVDPTLRPPAYIYSVGLGWLYRLVREPWRWKRQLALLTFAGMVSAAMAKRARS